MKYHLTSPVPKLLLRRPSAEAALESAKLLERMERAGWIRPVTSMPNGQSSIDLFSTEQLRAAVQKLEKEPLPL